MSADDFQTKYASVMESMLKSAVAETTKLFETMVDELKAEISRIKKENEDLRTRCSQFEKARRQPTVYTGKSEPLPGRSGGPDTCDTAVQCELVPFRTMLVEQCQPLRQSSLQNQEQQCSFEEMEYSLQEHNYVTHEEGNSQMAFILVKQESVLKQEEVEPNVVYGQVLSDTAGTFINQACSTVDMPLPQRHGETRVALELPCVGMDSGLQGAQNQSSELEHSLVISLAAIKDDMEEESEVSQKIKDTEIGTQEELIISEKQPLVAGQHQSEVELLEISVVPQQRQREGETSVNEQIDVTLQQYGDVQSIEEQLAQPTPLNKGEVCNELKNGVEECKDSSQPDLPVRRKRGRPPKKAKHPGQPIKEILNSPSSDIPREQGVKNSPTNRMEEVEVFPAVDTVNITSSKSPQATPVQPEAFSSIITLSVQEKANSVLGDVESSKVGSLAVSIASLSRRCSSEKEKPSQSQQLPMDTEKGAILVPSSEVSSVVNTLYTPPAESPQTLSMNPRERCTSVTLQDALLLVEAMNQSLVENTFSSPQRMAAPYQTQCPSRVSTLQTVDEVPAELQTPQLPIETCEASSTLPVTELSTTTQSAIEKRGTTLQTTDAASTHNSTTTSMPSPTAAIRSVQSFQQHCHLPLITLLASSRQGKAEPNKILVVPRSVSSLMPHKTAAQSSTQLPTVATQNNSTIPGSTAAGLPLGKPPLSSVPRKTIYVISRKLPPVVSSQSTTTKDLQSVIPPYPKITIIIPRQVSAGESSKHQSQTVVLTTKQESPKSTGPVTLSSSQLISSPQELSVSVDTQTQFGGVSTIPSQKRDNTSDKWESLEQTASVSEINAPSDIFSSLNLSVGPEPTSVSSVVPPTFEQNVSAVVKLTRLPFPMSTKESVLVSTLPTNGSSETPVAVSVNTSQMSEEPNYIQEKASFSSENCTILGKSFDSGYVQSSTPSKVSAPVNTTELSGVSGTAGEPTSNLDEEMISIAVQDCMSPNDVPIEKKQSAGLVHLTSITSKDISDPHLQMTKAQFLAQLEVSPVMQDPEKASSNDSVDARVSCAETSTSDKKRLQKNSLMTQLRCHLKNHFQARRTETNPELCTETETPTVSLNKTTLGNDSPNDKNTTSKPNHGSPINPGAVERVVSIEKTTIDPTPISPMRSGLCEDGIKSKSIVNEPASVSSRRSKAASESTPVSPRSSSSGQDDLGSKNKKSTSVSPRRSNSTKESASPKKTKNISLSSRRSSSTKSTSPRQIKNISVSPGRSSSTKESASPNKTKNTFVHPRRTTSTRDGASLKNTKTGDSPNITKTTSVRPKRTSSSRDGATPKKTKSTSISPRTSSLSESDSSPNISTSQSTSVNRRKCTFTKDGSSTKQIKGKSNSFSPRRFSITTDGAGTKNTKSEIGSPSVRWPKLGKDGVSPRKTGESTPAKKPKLIQDGTDPKNNLQVLNAKKLAKAAKAKTLAKMKNLNQSKLQNGAKTSCLADNRASCEAVKKFTAKAVWTPPRIPASRTTSTGGKRSLLLPVKKETRSQDHTVVYPHSVSLHPIPVKAPPIVSPLQPLSVIGRRLLKNQCGECGRVLSSGAALESHVSLHAGHRPYSCTLCGKRFPDSKGLKRHGRVHRNGRIHICQQCGKGFVYRFGLTKHLQMVHGRIKPFVCQICNKGFFTKRDVEAHIRIHTGEKPFHCNLCDKKFTRRVELNVHLRWHNGEKRHWCPYCGKGFLDFNNLKRHKYIHTGEKPHSCPHCPKNFTQSGHLKKHVKNVHKTQ